MLSSRDGFLINIYKTVKIMSIVGMGPLKVYIFIYKKLYIFLL